MKYVSLLRAVNVSGQKKVNMEQLRELYESLGFTDVQTYIQSGNVVFESAEKPHKIITTIQAKIQEAFGFDVHVFLRTKKDLGKIIEKCPFKDTGRVYVTFLSKKPESVPTDELKKVKHHSEEFSFGEYEVYFYCPEGYGKTKLSNNFFEKKLEVAATTRNWNTVNMLFSMM